MLHESLSRLQRDEAETVRKSREDLKKELSFLEEASEMFLKTFEVLSNENVQKFTYSKDASYRISYRIFRILRCASNSSLEGYYDISMALLRIAYENHLLMKYLSESEKEAILWFKGKRFSPASIRRNVSYSNNVMYQNMSEFIHSSFKSTFAFTKMEKNRTKANLGEYDNEQSKTVLLLVLLTMETTLIWLSLTFAQELMKRESWHSMFKKTVPKIWKLFKKLEKKT